MDKATATIIQWFDGLDIARRNEFIRELNSYIEGNIEKKAQQIRESKRILKVDAGPLSGVCFWCGR